MRSILSSVIIALGLLLLGCAVAVGLYNVKSTVRYVTVKGLCEIQKPADHAVLPIKYTETGNDLGFIYNELDRKNNVVVSFLLSNGIVKDEISMSAPVVIDKYADQYSNSINGPRYTASQVITVSSDKVDTVRHIMVKQVELLKSNIAVAATWDSQVQFFFTDIDSVKPQMVEQATKNARVTAEKFAEDSNSEIGKIITASQGQLTIDDRDQNTSYIKTLRIVTSIQYSLED